MYQRINEKSRRAGAPRRRTALYYPTNVLLFLAITASAWYGCSTIDQPDATERPFPALTPEEEMATFVLEPGLQVQLVASEPMIQDPVVATFDEDGRLWVVEMRAYMPNMDGEGERLPTGRVSVLQDTDGDGTMDISTVYLDSLIMPRALAVVANGILVVFEEALWLTKDLDGDLRADTTALIDADYAGSTLPEHTANGLMRGIDNWYYNAKSALRYRFTQDGWRKDSTEFRGQWGISHDDAGRLYYNYNWSQLHADLVPPNYLTRNKNYTPLTGIDQPLTLNRRVYPLAPTPAVNRGYIPGVLDEEKKLREFTAACSPLVYRGQALPDEYYGNAFVCEPSGNLIKRSIITEAGVHLAARDPHPGKEFMASTDERFRPVHLMGGPDGALYVVDMYRGLIQHKAYVTPYLREQTLSRNLVQPIHRGRIWRIVPEDWTAGSAPALSGRSTDQLVGYLSSNNGWLRDMAQRLLVERGDTRVVAKLTNLALKGGNRLARLHALWTLDGLNVRDEELLFRLITDTDPLIKSAALRVIEPRAVADAKVRERLGHVLTTIWEHAPIEQTLQIAFTASILDDQVSHELLRGIATRYDTSALMREAVMSSVGDNELVFLQKLLKAPEWRKHVPARAILLEMLAGAVVKKGNPGELKTLLGLLDVKGSALDWREQAILTGLAIQGYTGKVDPVRLSAEPRILRRTDLQIPASQVNGLKAIFEWPGSVLADTTEHTASVLSEAEKQRFALGRKFYLTSCSGCHGNNGEGLHRFAPPLRGSEWVLGDPRRLTLILLKGIEGPLEVAGKHYGEPEILPVMPAQFTLDNQTIAAILTYVRNEWGNQAGAVDAKLVSETRFKNQGRTLPWSAEELNAHMDKPQP